MQDELVERNGHIEVICANLPIMAPSFLNPKCRDNFSLAEVRYLFGQALEIVSPCDLYSTTHKSLKISIKFNHLVATT
jgi:hypothetical protein